MKPEWIAVDWGTSRLRAYAVGGGAVLARAASDDGMSRLGRDGFEPALLRLVAPWLAEGRITPTLVCGMAGSRQGWREAPYRSVPCLPLEPSSLVSVPVSDPRLTVHLVPGLKQAAPPDVMRGEETQIAGALALVPGFDGVVCLPGTHSKWALVSAGEVVSFQTFLTGEMFALLSERSVLRHGMSGADGWDNAAFDAALSEALSRPERIGALLFRIRSEGLLSGLSAQAARSRLSGLLVGIELAASRPYWLGQKVLLVGATQLAEPYARALLSQGLSPRILAGEDTVIAGLSRFLDALAEPAP